MFHKAPSIVWRIHFQIVPKGFIHLAGSKMDKVQQVESGFIIFLHHSVIGSSWIVPLKAAIMEKSMIEETKTDNTKGETVRGLAPWDTFSFFDNYENTLTEVPKNPSTSSVFDVFVYSFFVPLKNILSRSSSSSGPFIFARAAWTSYFQRILFNFCFINNQRRLWKKTGKENVLFE